MTLTAHPYADAWPMLGEDELAELAEDIRANGLRHPIVTYNGQILDGRNRYAACLRIDARPEFEEFAGTDDDALAFVQSINGARRHQSKGSLAASWALSMLAAGKRSSGRWEYGAAKGQDLDLHKQWRSMLGLIADERPELLAAIRDEEYTLGAAHAQAQTVRQHREEREEQERREAEAEAAAEEFVRERDADLAAQVGATFQTWTEAKLIWEQRNREEAQRIAAAERAERDRKAAIERGIKDALTHISNAVQFLSTTDAALFASDTLPHRDRYPSESRYLAAEHVDAAIDYLTTIRKAL